MNPMKFMQFKPLLERFRDRHPKFIQFFGYAAGHISAGSVLEITVTDPEGKKIVTNIRVDEEDIALFHQFKEML
ncbi:MAG: hypothetical protein IKK51_10915 [Oscillospiraceae bacterium]|nr:hypothetical protein [Oscillospiraceae bacterium]MBR4102363.1 hypothetical protein [Oscillospiraceae bacterium]MBR6618601.1 hypothetical protein [Oscillospiraceae bacterium]